MLPPAAFTDPAVLDWELDEIFSRLDLRRARLPGERAGPLPDARDRPRQRRRDRRRGRPAARLPQRLPPSGRPPGHRGRGQRQAPPAVPLPRLVLRPRRRAPRLPAHGRRRELRPLLQRAGPGAPLDRRAACCWSTSAARRPIPPSTSATSSSTSSAIGTPSCAAPARSTTSSPRTGRGSSRTTTSACTARASIPELNALSNYMSGEEMRGRRRLVRRLDDADRRGRRDDGERAAATRPTGRRSRASRART